MGRGKQGVPQARQGQRVGKNRGINKAQDKREVANRRLAAAAVTATEGFGDWRQVVVQQEAKLDSELLELAREVLAEAPGFEMALAAAGSALQARVRAAGLRGDDGMVLNTSRHIKSRYGGWPGFARSAPSILIISGETVRLVAASAAPDSMVDDASVATRAPRTDVSLAEVKDMPTVLSSLGLGGAAATAATSASEPASM